ncbi:MAG: protease complex subunit PrcB family protein [Planctomycetota bacterium]
MLKVVYRCGGWVVVSAFALVLWGCAGSGGDNDAGPATVQALATSAPILGQVSGDEPAIQSYGLGVLDPAAFADLGLDTKFVDQGVKVDFARHSVILLSLGEQPTGGYAAEITALQVKGNEVFVQATATRPGPEATVTQAITYPYAAVATEKLPAGVVLRSDITSLP